MKIKKAHQQQQSKNKNTRMSHHKYLKVCVNFNKSERGVGYWKLNIFLLKHDQYKKKGFLIDLMT